MECVFVYPARPPTPTTAPIPTDWASVATKKTFVLDVCAEGMKRLGYFGWKEDPAGTRLAVRGVSNYRFDPTNSAAIMAAGVMVL